MADIFSLSGCYKIEPGSGVPSGDPVIDAPLDESLYLQAKQILTVTLSSDAVESVAFGDLAGANVIVISAVGGKVRARFTSTDGAQQSVPVDPIAIVMSSTVPVTALDLMRVAGSGTVTCRVFIGEKSA